MDEGDTPFQPLITLWVDAPSSMIRAFDTLNPQQSPDKVINKALQVLKQALTDPVNTFPNPATEPSSLQSRLPPSLEMPQPSLPAVVRVNDAALVEPVRSLLSPYGVKVEYADHLPAFDQAYDSIAKMMGASSEDALLEPFSWEIDPQLLPPLLKHATAFVRSAPWTYMPDYPPLAIELGELGPDPGVETLYACILGAGGEVTGMAFYYTAEGLQIHRRQGDATMITDERAEELIEEMRAAGAPVDQLPPEMLLEMVRDLVQQEEGGPDQGVAQVDALICFFSPPDEHDPTYIRWLRGKGVNIHKRQLVPSFFQTRVEEQPRNPTNRETTALVASMEAINAFIATYGATLQSPLLPLDALTHQIQVGSGPQRQAITVTFPASGFDLDEEDEEEFDEPLEPPSPTLYRFQVKLAWQKTAWRRLELRAEQTLHDLHCAIQVAFDWDDDHLYAFFLSGKAWDSTTEYAGPFNELDSDEPRFATQYRLENLPLKLKQEFLYIFDFGDELRHLIKLEAIVPNGVDPQVDYPRVTESQGANVPQYPNLDEDYDLDEDDEDG